MELSHLLMLLSTGGGGATKRKAWDLKGKVSDMEGKLRDYQTKVKSVHQENEVLKGTMVQSKTRVAEMEKNLERQKSQIRYKDDFIWKSGKVFHCHYVVVPLICLFR